MIIVPAAAAPGHPYLVVPQLSEQNLGTGGCHPERVKGVVPRRWAGVAPGLKPAPAPSQRAALPGGGNQRSGKTPHFPCLFPDSVGALKMCRCLS